MRVVVIVFWVYVGVPPPTHGNYHIIQGFLCVTPGTSWLRIHGLGAILTLQGIAQVALSLGSHVHFGSSCPDTGVTFPRSANDVNKTRFQTKPGYGNIFRVGIQLHPKINS